MFVKRNYVRNFSTLRKLNIFEKTKAPGNSGAFFIL